MTGGRCSSYTDEENQALAQECGIIGPIEAQKEFSGDPAPVTMAALILAYRLDPDSPYRKLRYHTRQIGAA